MSRNNPTSEDRTWFEFVAAKGDDPAEILIYDYIGSYGVSATAFDRALKDLGAQTSLTMRINSPGGETPTAASIYNMLERYVAKHGTDLTVIIDGIAASSASWIAMLGDEIVMPENTLMMIHDPSGLAYGTSREMRSLAAVLDKIKQGMVAAYVKKSGKDRAEVEQIMEDETWYSAEEAVAEHFADRVDNPIQIAASFDLSRFKNPPPPVEASARIGAKQETPMVTKPNETAAEMETRIRAEVEASLAAPQPVITPAPVVENAQQMEARIRGEISAKHAEINSLCAIAGKPALAAGFIAANKTVAEVRAELEAAVGQTSSVQTQHKIETDKEPANKGLVVASIDAPAVWANFNKGKGTPVVAH